MRFPAFLGLFLFFLVIIFFVVVFAFCVCSFFYFFVYEIVELLLVCRVTMVCCFMDFSFRVGLFFIFLVSVRALVLICFLSLMFLLNDVLCCCFFEGLGFVYCFGLVGSVCFLFC